MVRLLGLILIISAHAQMGEQATVESAGYTNSFFLKHEVINGIPQDVLYYQGSFSKPAHPVDRAFLVSLREKKDIDAMKAWQDFLTKHEPMAGGQYLDVNKYGYQPDRNMRISLQYLPAMSYLTGEMILIPESVGKAEALSVLQRADKVRGDCSQLYQDTLPAYKDFFIERAYEINTYAATFYDGGLIDPMCARPIIGEELKRYQEGMNQERQRLLDLATLGAFRFSIIENVYANDNPFGDAGGDSGSFAIDPKSNSPTRNTTDGDKNKKIKEGKDQAFIAEKYDEILEKQKNKELYYAMEAKNCETNECREEYESLVDMCKQITAEVEQERLEELASVFGAATGSQMTAEIVKTALDAGVKGVQKSQSNQKGETKTTDSTDYTASADQDKKSDTQRMTVEEFYQNKEENIERLTQEYASDGRISKDEQEHLDKLAQREYETPIESLPVQEIKLVTSEELQQTLDEMGIEAIKNMQISLDQSSHKAVLDKEVEVLDDGDAALITAVFEMDVKADFEKKEDYKVTSRTDFNGGGSDEITLDKESFYDKFVFNGDYIDYANTNKDERVDVMTKDIMVNAIERGKKVSSEQAVEIARQYEKREETVINYDRLFKKATQVELTDTELEQKIEQEIAVAKEIKDLKASIAKMKNPQEMKTALARLKKIESNKTNSFKDIKNKIAKIDKQIEKRKKNSKTQVAGIDSNIIENPNQIMPAQGNAQSSGRKGQIARSISSARTFNSRASYAPIAGDYTDYLQKDATLENSQKVIADLGKQKETNETPSNASQDVQAVSVPTRSPASVKKTSAKQSELKKDYYKYVRYENGEYFLYSDIYKERDREVIDKNMKYLKDNSKEFKMIGYGTANNPLKVKNEGGKLKAEQSEHELIKIIKDSVIEDYVEIGEGR